MDYTLRRAETLYAVIPTEENLERLNIARGRAGLEWLAFCKECKKLKLVGPECDFCGEPERCQDCAKPAGPLTPGTVPGQHLREDPDYACDKCGTCKECQTRVCPTCDDPICTKCDDSPICRDCRTFDYGLCKRCHAIDIDEEEQYEEDLHEGYGDSRRYNPEEEEEERKFSSGWQK